jgi:phenylacetate-coenzyme A ligase PaaK-like adenylate-forming protein
MVTARGAVLRDGRADALRVWWDALRVHRQGPAAIHTRQRERLADQVAFAREHSAFYRDLYHGLPERVDDATMLPVTDKRQLMARFDDVLTDPAVRRADVEAFVADPARIGTRFAGKYLVATTAGTTGTRGLFVLDDRYWAVASGMMAQLGGDWLSPIQLVRLMVRGGRFATVVATGGHFLSVAAGTRERREKPRLHRRLRIFSVHWPMSELVAGLNLVRPVLLLAYASVLRLLAAEQESGRLSLQPMLVVSTAEGLPPGERERIQRAFSAPVREVYGCTESSYAAASCTRGWLHLLEDWLILEPVDADYRPVPPGVVSHTVLMTNLANRVQPILRYDVGDRVLMKPDACECGNPAPALKVEGRASDVLTFPAADRQGHVAVPPLALGTVIDRTPGVELFQIAQSAPTRLSVRLLPEPGADPDQVRRSVVEGLAALLTSLGLAHVAVDADAVPPQQSAGGKFRTVIPLPPTSAQNFPPS